MMLTYNEDPARIFAALETMAAGVAERGAGGKFDWFLLSDTTDPAVALAEEEAFVHLRERLGGRTAAFYRRRRANVGRKVGNVADFCKRWGGAYDYLVMLDADSLMAPEAILELVRRMEADPDAGLVQSVPKLVNGTTVLARLLQFAGSVYGPLVAAGFAWWTGGEGNYWGHNAVIRRKAFTEATGLPELSGKPPFGGQILSHDFVEAAMIRRAGWRVVVADDVDGSYEECPPTLIDLAIRDRRWCQGNLQHARLLAAAGFNWVSRFHLFTGIVSYIASPLWLLLIVAGLALGLQAQYVRPEYFDKDFQLFPTWPAMDPVWALWLFAGTALVLFGPKLIGLGVLLTDGNERRAVGGGYHAVRSVVVEILVSALIAPVMMLIQTGLIASILMGIDAGWKPQRRDEGGIAWRDIVRRHRWHVVTGLVLGWIAYLISPAIVLWLTPALAGMVLAMPVSGLTGSAAAGRLFMRRGVLTIPEESEEPAAIARAKELRPFYAAIVEAAPDLARIVRDERRRRIHLALTDRRPPRQRGSIDPVEAVASAKIDDAHSVEEAVSYLARAEAAAVLATPALFQQLCGLANERERSAA
jgi:membrane glycosyltransferase